MVFMIIVVGAYTASFAAQRNADSMSDISSTIDSVKDLVEESEMQSGIIRGGSTEAYLQVFYSFTILIKLSFAFYHLLL